MWIRKRSVRSTYTATLSQRTANPFPAGRSAAFFDRHPGPPPGVSCLATGLFRSYPFPARPKSFPDLGIPVILLRADSISAPGILCHPELPVRIPKSKHFVASHLSGLEEDASPSGPKDSGRYSPKVMDVRDRSSLSHRPHSDMNNGSNRVLNSEFPGTESRIKNKTAALKERCSAAVRSCKSFLLPLRRGREQGVNLSFCGLEYNRPAGRFSGQGSGKLNSCSTDEPAGTDPSGFSIRR